MLDYKTVNSSVKPFANPGAAGFGFVGLYNGNIAAMSVNIGKFTVSTAQEGALLYTYRYDQLNRLTKMSTYKGLNVNTNSWNVSATNAYREDITYDANGNIKTYKRNGADGNLMDNMTYGYNIQSGKLVNNRLRHVKDAVGDGYSPDDIDNQSDDNYGYDVSGNLIRDTKEGITSISWSVYGKIRSINKSGVGTITYTYDPNGNRISKTAGGKTTWYVRDAAGNVQAVYEKRSDLNGGDLTETEVHLYGCNRLGVFMPNVDVQNPGTVSEITNFDRGRKFFELNNHLGNVLVTVSDRKLQVDDGEYVWVYSPCPPPPPGGPAPNCDPIYMKVSNTPDGVADYFVADVINANDYYPFGMMMPGRTYTSGNQYRYGFNGLEKDKDLNPNTYTTLFREIDARLGRWWSIDPKASKYPGQSPYVAFNNNPIFHDDPFGDDPPKGFKKHTNTVNGQAVFLPKSATTENFENGDREKAGTLRAFNIGKVRFVASYDPKTKKFLGYLNSKTLKAYKSPDITLKSGGISGDVLDATFDVKDVPASSLQIVQTVYGTPRISDKKAVGPTSLTIGKTSYTGAVDGGKNSIYVTEGGNPPAHPTNPYYLTSGEVASQVSFNTTTNSGTVRVYDNPNGQYLRKALRFETIIVATNYMGSGQDVILGSFNWGWTGQGTSTIHSATGTGISLNNSSPNGNSQKIISNDYPTYKFFGQK
jgi:RHS repeat-associated protein